MDQEGSLGLLGDRNCQHFRLKLCVLMQGFNLRCWQFLPSFNPLSSSTDCLLIKIHRPQSHASEMINGVAEKEQRQIKPENVEKISPGQLAPVGRKTVNILD